MKKTKVSFGSALRRVILGIGACCAVFAFQAVRADAALGSTAQSATQSAISAQSYYLDTRCPILATSEAGKLDTNPAGLCIILR